MKFLTLIALLVSNILLVSAQVITSSIAYLGTGELNNFELKLYNSSSQTQAFKLNKGFILLPLKEQNVPFILAQDCHQVLAGHDSIRLKLIAYANEMKVFPEIHAQYTIYHVVDSTELKLLKAIESKEIYGEKAQVMYWKSKFSVSIPDHHHLYNFKKQFKYSSETSGTMSVLGYIDSTFIDTLIGNKPVGTGDYLISINELKFGGAIGKEKYLISDVKGERFLDTPLTTQKDSLELNIPFDFTASKLYLKTKLALYDTEGKVLKHFFERKAIQKGKFNSRETYKYYGIGDEAFQLKLTNRKNEVLKEETITYNQLMADRQAGIGKDSYQDIKVIYASKKPEKRAICTLETPDGRILALVFENKNIHTGTNKINYTLKHQLESNSIVYVIVKSKAGRILYKQEISII